MLPMLDRETIRKDLITNGGTMLAWKGIKGRSYLAKVTCTRINDHRIVIRIGKHRILDIVDAEEGQLAMHKGDRSGDTVYANPLELLTKLSDVLTKQKAS